jgi:hypothetical protein
MADADRDPALDALLDLDGQVFFVDDRARYWVKFEVKRVAVSIERPHGLRYSLTLHDATGQRLVGFDNAHPAAAASGPAADHRHWLRTIRPYDYAGAGSCWRISGRPSMRC